MNYGRLVLAAVAATAADALYGVLVWGMVLNGEFARYPQLYRPADDMSGFPLMFAGILGAMLVASWIYAKGYEGGSAVAEGLKFGIVLGLLMGLYISSTHFGTMPIGRRLALTYVVGEFGEFLLAGFIIALVYRPAAVRAVREEFAGR
jgi:hypothetical protein